MTAKWDSNEDIQRFREYLRIPTVQPNVNYGIFVLQLLGTLWYFQNLLRCCSIDECVNFLKQQADELDLPIQIHYPSDPTKPVLIITWQGVDPTLKSILLNSHMDVVPVYREHWTHEPFEAEIDDEGRIYARGSQDMKSVGMQYLRAVKGLRDQGIQLKRTVHLMYVPGMTFIITRFSNLIRVYKSHRRRDWW